MAVFVLDKHKKPLMPTTEKRARLLLERGKAVVIKLYPFTIRLKYRIGGNIQPLRVKLDPGSSYTGVAVVRENKVINTLSGEIKVKIAVLNLFQINHRGLSISENLASRSAMRRRGRANLRYRKCRTNRAIAKEWLAPSKRHRVNTVMSWLNKLQQLAPVKAFSQEFVRFDIQKLQNSEIIDIEYQQGELLYFEIKEYLLEKWGRKCVYCGLGDRPLENELVIARENGGSNCISNLTISCEPCNQNKGTIPIEVFLAKKPKLLQKIQSQLKQPLKVDAVNNVRRTLAARLKASQLPVELSSGGRTKFNRYQHSIPKTPAHDAACVGEFNEIENWNIPTLQINCAGRGSYQRTRLNKYGFPRGYLMRQKSVNGFQTGDMVKAVVTKGKKVGEYKGRVSVRANGYFNINDKTGVIQGISYKDCKLLSRNDGYGYKHQSKIV